MSGLKRRFINGAMQLFGGYGGQQALMLLRNVIIARLLGPDNFGIAATFIIVISVLEVMSDLGVELYLVRAKDGDEVAVQNTLQTVLIVRGLLIGAGIFVLADVAAELFGAPSLGWAYRTLAIVPIVKGFKHLDVRRQQRTLVYLPEILSGFAGILAGLAVAVCFGLLWHSYEAMLAAYIADAVAGVAVSHIVAQRAYRLAFSRPVFRTLGSYGWPLLLNGFMLFWMNQGDRFIVGTQLGSRELAEYAVAAILATGPAMLILKVTGALYLPLLSEQGISASRYARRYELLGAMNSIAALSTALLLIVCGTSIIGVVYGPEYTVAQPVVAGLAVMSGARILRSWPQAAALSHGMTRDVLYANILSAMGIALAAVVVHVGFGAAGIAASVAGSEVVSLVFAVERLKRRRDPAVHGGRMMYLIYVALVCLSMAVILFLPAGSVLLHMLALVALLGLGLLAVIMASVEFRGSIGEVVGRAARWKIENNWQ